MNLVVWGEDEYYHRKADGQPHFDGPVAAEDLSRLAGNASG